MGLTCSCDYEADPGETIYYAPDDYTTLKTKRSRKCESCHKKIAVGSICAEVPRVKIPDHDLERRIYGDDGEIPRAPAYLCEQCTDILFSLEDLGYCPQPWENQRELLADYHDLHAPMPHNDANEPRR